MRNGIPRFRNRILFFLTVALCAFAIQGHAGDRKKMPPGKIDGSVLYHNYCSVCHGDAGDGKSRARNSLLPPPADFTSPQLQGKLTTAYMTAIVKDGKPGTAMVGWKTQLNDAEVAAVVDHVRRTFVEHAGDEAMKKGRTLYGHLCVNCHGVDGTGKLGATAAGGARPRDLTTASAQKELTRERIITAIAVGKKGTSMQGFAGQVSGPDIEAIADFVKANIVTGKGVGISGTSAHAGRESKQ